MVARTIPATLLVSLLAVASAAQAVGVYQWKDAKGVTHFADAPPPSGRFNARELHAPAPTEATPAAAPAVVPPSAETNCAIARANLARLHARGPIGLDANGDGKPDAVMGDSERATQATLAQRNIATFCGKAPPAP